MRSTRVAAAWAGIALATSFLSVTIIGMQPHTRAAERVALTSSSVVAPVVKQVDVADSTVKPVRIER